MFKKGDRVRHDTIGLATVLEDQEPTSRFVPIRPDVRPVTMVGWRFNADPLNMCADLMPGQHALDEETAKAINTACSTTDRERNGSELDTILRALLERLGFTLTVLVIDEIERL